MGEHVMHSPGKNVPREIHTKDVQILEEKMSNPVLSLTELLHLDEQNRAVNDEYLSLGEGGESIDGD